MPVYCFFRARLKIFSTAVGLRSLWHKDDVGDNFTEHYFKGALHHQLRDALSFIKTNIIFIETENMIHCFLRNFLLVFTLFSSRITSSTRPHTLPTTRCSLLRYPSCWALPFCEMNVAGAKNCIVGCKTWLSPHFFHKTTAVEKCRPMKTTSLPH